MLELGLTLLALGALVCLVSVVVTTIQLARGRPVASAAVTAAIFAVLAGAGAVLVVSAFGSYTF